VVVPGFEDFRDEEGAPFYRSSVRAFATPEATLVEILRRFRSVMLGALEAAERRPVAIEVGDVLAWHRAIFASTFPHEAGEVRSGPTWFGVRWREHETLRRRMVEGVEPRHVRDDLWQVLKRYNDELRSRRPRERSLREALGAAAQLYAELLTIHPFEDGNLRAAFPALQTALLSLGAPAVHFHGAVAEHDEALGWALRPDAEMRTIQPFVDLLKKRIAESSGMGTGGVPWMS